MAGNGKHGGGDRVLESRHLVGLFLGVVLLCGVFFTLGYVMGRTQYGGAVHAADAVPKYSPLGTMPGKSAARETQVSPPAKPEVTCWDDCSKNTDPTPPSKSPSPVPATPNKTAKLPAPAPTKAPTTKEPQRLQPLAIGKNSIILQVAAIKQQRDALDMADVLQKKKFPSFVANSPADSFYHVQVGPYPDLASAENAKHALEQLGFKSIIKR
jgi:DedD protein